MSASLVVEGGVARLTLERPEALNALNRDVAAALVRQRTGLVFSDAPVGRDEQSPLGLNRRRHPARCG